MGEETMSMTTTRKAKKRVTSKTRCKTCTEPKPLTKKRLAKAVKRLDKLPMIKPAPAIDRITMDMLKDPDPCPDCKGAREWTNPNGPYVHAVCFACRKEQVFNRATGVLMSGGSFIAADRQVCPSCGGMKVHHSDHAVGGFEICTTCKGTGYKKLTVVNKGEFMKIISDCAIRYRREGIYQSLRRNSHMHNWNKRIYNHQDAELVDAVLVDFINFMGTFQGVDYGMYTKHLSWENMQHTCQYREIGTVRKKPASISNRVFICQNVKKMKGPGQPKCEKKDCPEWKEPA